MVSRCQSQSEDIHVAMLPNSHTLALTCPRICPYSQFVRCFIPHSVAEVDRSSLQHQPPVSVHPYLCKLLIHAEAGAFVAVKPEGPHFHPHP